ncbi:class D sortase [Eubacteriales bacterium OttesenSCG-928-M02]|nr:class D sortase [Eubacteriales bacterium OttesenSCG-928-M02]
MRRRVMISSLILLSAAALMTGLFLLHKERQGQKQIANAQAGLIESIEHGHGDYALPWEDGEVWDIYSGTDTPLVQIDTQDTHGIAILSIPKIELCIPVVEGVQPRDLRIAAGHMRESGEIGALGNCILLAHRSYTYGQLFNRLDELEEKDYVTLSYSGLNYVYRVIGKRVIDPGDPSMFDWEIGQRKLTLVTCTPLYKGTHRLLVECELIP